MVAAACRYKLSPTLVNELREFADQADAIWMSMHKLQSSASGDEKQQADVLAQAVSLMERYTETDTSGA